MAAGGRQLHVEDEIVCLVFSLPGTEYCTLSTSTGHLSMDIHIQTYQFWFDKFTILFLYCCAQHVRQIGEFTNYAKRNEST